MSALPYVIRYAKRVLEWSKCLPPSPAREFVIADAERLVRTIEEHYVKRETAE